VLYTYLFIDDEGKKARGWAMKGELWKAVIFSAVVALAAIGLGILYDVTHGITLHFCDALAKILITFTAVFVFSVSVGYGFMPGIVTSLAGPVGFTIYYTLAAPSLERSALSIPGTILALIANIVILALFYWIVRRSVMSRGGRILFSATVAFAVLALHWAWLTVLNLTGFIPDLPLSFGTAFTTFIVLYVLTFLATFLGRGWWPGIIAGVIFGIAGIVAGAAALDSLVRVFLYAIPYIFIAKSLRGKK